MSTKRSDVSPTWLLFLRITRAPVAQLVKATTRMMVQIELLCRYAARMIIKGRPGMTSARFVTKLITSSRIPGR